MQNRSAPEVIRSSNSGVKPGAQTSARVFFEPKPDEPRIGKVVFMGKTAFEKIWDAHRVSEIGDGTDLILIDRILLHDAQAVSR